MQVSFRSFICVEGLYQLYSTQVKCWSLIFEAGLYQPRTVWVSRHFSFLFCILTIASLLFRVCSLISVPLFVLIIPSLSYRVCRKFDILPAACQTNRADMGLPPPCIVNFLIRQHHHMNLWAFRVISGRGRVMRGGIRLLCGFTMSGGTRSKARTLSYVAVWLQTFKGYALCDMREWLVGMDLFEEVGAENSKLSMSFQAGLNWS